MNATPHPTTLHVMDAAEGTAALMQLNAMIRALDGFDQDAIDANDKPVMRLIGRLYAAREAADEIAARPQPNEKKKGVSLAKH